MLTEQYCSRLNKDSPLRRARARVASPDLAALNGLLWHRQGDVQERSGSLPIGMALAFVAQWDGVLQIKG
jgi:hypothetical protein